MKLRRRPHGRSVPPRRQNGHRGGVGCKPAQARRWDLLPVAQMTGGLCGAGSRRLPLDHARHSTRRRIHPTSTLSRCPAGEGRHSRQRGGMGACSVPGEIECGGPPTRRAFSCRCKPIAELVTKATSGGLSWLSHAGLRYIAQCLVMTNCP